MHSTPRVVNGAAVAPLLGHPQAKIENMLDAIYFHDWRTDPFARGAYSYGLAGADAAQETLAAPVENRPPISRAAMARFTARW